MEGLELAAPLLKEFILPLTCAVLVGLFAIQSRGTGRVGALFGPVMLLWFVTIGGLGAFQVVRHPGVLAALDPSTRPGTSRRHGGHGALVLGASSWSSPAARPSTPTWGTSARGPFRIAWLGLVMPALVLNYFGQGARMLSDPATMDSPFFAI